MDLRRVHCNYFNNVGCIVVVFNPQSNKQVQFLRARQPVCSIAVSSDGKLIAAGQRGKLAPITVWNAATGSVAWELAHHVGGVASLEFSPDGRCLVSCGFRTDKSLAVWDTTSGQHIGSGRLSQKVAALAFAESGGQFVTAGKVGGRCGLLFSGSLKVFTCCHHQENGTSSFGTSGHLAMLSRHPNLSSH